MNILIRYQKAINRLSVLNDIPTLFFHIVLTYGFYDPTTMKWGNISGIAEWFGGMGIPLPTLNAYLAASTEMADIPCLFLFSNCTCL